MVNNLIFNHVELNIKYYCNKTVNIFYVKMIYTDHSLGHIDPTVSLSEGPAEGSKRVQLPGCESAGRAGKRESQVP